MRSTVLQWALGEIDRWLKSVDREFSKLGLGDLGSFFLSAPQEIGTWFWFEDSDTGFGHWNARHPWVLPNGHDPSRTALVHALPRSTVEPRDGKDGTDFLVHHPHDICYDEPCELNQKAWIVADKRPLGDDWIANGQMICVEKNMTVRAQIERFEMDLW